MAPSPWRRRSSRSRCPPPDARPGAAVGDTARQTAARDALVAALGNGKLSRSRVEEAVRHVLEAKARFGMLGGEAAPEPGC
jgi:hypothetical protein